MKNISKLIVLIIVAFIFGFVTGHTVYYRQELKYAKKQMQRLYRLSKEPNSPIKFIQAENSYAFEYNIAEHGKNIIKVIPINFSSLAALHLAHQKYRSSVESDEIKKIIYSIKDKKTLDEITEVIGEPDEIDSNIGNDELQYKYKRLSKGFELIIHKSFQGKIDFTYGPE